MKLLLITATICLTSAIWSNEAFAQRYATPRYNTPVYRQPVYRQPAGMTIVAGNNGYVGTYSSGAGMTLFQDNMGNAGAVFGPNNQNPIVAPMLPLQYGPIQQGFPGYYGGYGYGGYPYAYGQGGFPSAYGAGGRWIAPGTFVRNGMGW